MRRSPGPWIAGLALLAVAAPSTDGEESKPERRKREIQDEMGGVPEAILRLQSLEKVKVPAIEEAAAIALKAAAEAAAPLVDEASHAGGRRLAVPDAFGTIQAAIDAAKAGDVVVVKAGVYFELLTMKDGVKLVSDSADGGDEPAAVEGARLTLPRRALRTILDGSRAQPSSHGMIDFERGSGRKTVVDGFTVRNLPRQNHHLPGHAHALNLRGASPVVTRCYVHDNGSTGIGSHVVYRDQDAPMGKRDLRRANVAHEASAVLYRNVVRGNLGLGIGCNHFSAPHILGNEVFGNDDSPLGEEPSPGIGAKHGAAPVIVGNLVHDNPGGGILSSAGEPQGAHGIDRPTRPTVRGNVVWRNGKVRPGVSSSAGGSAEGPVLIAGNFVYEAGAAGIALADGAFGVVEENMVSGSALTGISIRGSTALRLNRNRAAGSGAGGFAIVEGSTVREMRGNAADGNQGPRFLLRESRIEDPGERGAPGGRGE